jgi:hypothetical protein
MFALCATVAGCSSPLQLTQAQLNAIETREVDADLGQTFNAASGALFDMGYIIIMSDRNAGLLTGTKSNSRRADRCWVSPYIEGDVYAVSIQVRELTSKLSAVRVKTSYNGAPVVDKKVIDQIWVLMQRQVLMKEPISSLVETSATTDNSK